MRLPLLKLLFSAICAIAAIGVAQAPSDALGCWFGCCHGGCRPYSAGRYVTPYSASYYAPAMFGAPVYASPSCGSYGVVASPSCGTCGDVVYGGGEGDCQVGSSTSVDSAGPTIATPSDKWKKKTYDQNDAPLGGSRTDSSEDKIRSGTGGAGAEPNGGTGTDGAVGGRGGIPDEGEDISSRSTLRPSDNSTAPDPGSFERVKIEPRNGGKNKVPGPAPAEVEDEEEAQSDAKGNTSGGLTLPQASRLDHVVAAREAPLRERVSLKKSRRPGQLVRVAEYANTPWNHSPDAPAVARNP